MSAITPHDIWNALQPYLPFLLTEAATETGKRLPGAIGKLWQTLTERMQRKPAAAEALDDLKQFPDDPDAQAAFRQQIKKLLRDEDFAAQLAALLQAAGTRYEAHLEGDGAIAQGDGATAVGKGGVYIGGDASGNIIVTGDKNKIEK